MPPVPKRSAKLGGAIMTASYRANSVDAERSFSQYKHMLTDRRENLTEQHTKQLLVLKFYGDIEGRLQWGK